MRTTSRWLLALLLACACASGGCSTLGYYAQAISGQVEIIRKSRAIPQVLSDPATSADLRQRLQRVLDIRDFASSQLALPDNDSYRRYADLDRKFVVWNVFAAPEFSLEPKEWCFPFAGCVGYKGYFAEDGAQRFAAQLREERYDVYVGGVPAYSTLGWFKDPVLNTFIRYPETELARLIFHELAHQVAYAKGDTPFNESFAVAVEEEGVQRWLAARGTDEQKSAFVRTQQLRDAFLKLITRYRERFAQLYASGEPPEKMRAEKAALVTQMRADYESLKGGLPGLAGYDAWFAQPVNNAQLASVAIYTQLVPAFQALLKKHEGDLPSFYAEVARIAKLPQAERDNEINALMPR